MKNCLVGYVYDSDGRYRYKYLIRDDADTVARFICQFPENNKVLTDELDNFKVSTIGCFLDQVFGEDFLKELQAAIIPYQTGKKELKELEFTKTDAIYFTQNELLPEWEADIQEWKRQMKRSKR